MLIAPCGGCLALVTATLARFAKCVILAALPSASQGVTDESFVYTSPRGRRQGDKTSLR